MFGYLNKAVEAASFIGNIIAPLPEDENFDGDQTRLSPSNAINDTSISVGEEKIISSNKILGNTLQPDDDESTKSIDLEDDYAPHIHTGLDNLSTLYTEKLCTVDDEYDSPIVYSKEESREMIIKDDELLKVRNNANSYIAVQNEVDNGEGMSSTVLREKDIAVNETLRKQVSKLQATIDGLATAQDSLERKICQRNTEISSLKNELEEKKILISTLQSNYQSTIEELADRERICNELQMSILTKTTEMNELINIESDYHKLQNDFEVQGTQIFELQTALTTTQMNCENLQSQIDLCNSEKDIRTTQNVTMLSSDILAKLQELYMYTVDQTESLKINNSHENIENVALVNCEYHNNDQEIYEIICSLSYSIRNIISAFVSKSKRYDDICRRTHDILNHWDEEGNNTSGVDGLSNIAGSFDETNESLLVQRLETVLQRCVIQNNTTASTKFTESSNGSEAVQAETVARDIETDSRERIIQSQASTIQQLQMSVMQAEASHRSCEDQIKAQSETIISLEAQVQALEADLVACTSETVQWKTTSQSRDQWAAELQTKLESASREVESGAGEVLRLKDLLLQARESAAITLENSIRAKDSELSNAASQVGQLKQQLLKSENEARQLREVVSQLRQVRKVSKEDVDAVVNQRDDLKRQVDVQLQELEKLKTALAQSLSESEKLAQTRAELSEQDRKVAALEKQLEDLRRSNGQLQQWEYESRAALEVARADTMVLRQDLSTTELELRNTQTALRTVERERDNLSTRMQIEKAAMEENFRLKRETDREAVADSYADKMLEFDIQIRNLSDRVEEEQLHRRKAEMEFYNEKLRMHKALEVTLHRLQDTQEDHVDRAVITNLIVTYFRRNRSREVLELIARILGFTDEEKTVVGLREAAGLSTIFSAFMGITPTAAPVDVDGDNLAELWVNFLLHESDASPAATPPLAGSGPRSPRAPTLPGSASTAHKPYNAADKAKLPIPAPISVGARTPLIQSRPRASVSGSNTAGSGSPFFTLIPQSPTFEHTNNGGGRSSATGSQAPVLLGSSSRTSNSVSNQKQLITSDDTSLMQEVSMSSPHKSPASSIASL